MKKSIAALSEGRKLAGNFEAVADVAHVVDHRNSFHKRASYSVHMDRGQIPRFPLRTKNSIMVHLKGSGEVGYDRTDNLWACGEPFALSYGCPVADVAEHLPKLVDAFQVRQERIWLAMLERAALLNTEVFDFVAPALTGNFEGDLKAGQYQLNTQLASANASLSSRYRTVYISADLAPAALATLGAREDRAHEVDHGYVGSIIVDGREIDVYTDAYREEEHRFLPPNTMIHVTDPLNHGGYSETWLESNIVDEQVSFVKEFTAVVTSTHSVVLQQS